MKKSKKFRYRHSTPVLRLRRNSTKITKHTNLVKIRLQSWCNGMPDKLVEKALDVVERILVIAIQLDCIMGELEKSNFVPPKRSSALHFEIGQHVAIAQKYRETYKLMMAPLLEQDPTLLDDLMISNIMPTGKLVVRRGKTPFIAAKCHLVILKDVHVSSQG